MQWSGLEGALSAIRAFVPKLTLSKHKGQAGRIAVIGGCREYTGAPFFAAMTALKVGADVVHVICTKDASPVIKSYSPELIVHPLLQESYEIHVDGDAREKMINAIVHDVNGWVSRFTSLVVGPGLGRDPFLLECLERIMRIAREKNIPMVIDADGLFLINQKPELVKNYSLCVLTPNKVEYQRLFSSLFGEHALKNNLANGQIDDVQTLKEMANKLGNVTVLKKGQVDLISDGNSILQCGEFGSPRRCGGQGDVLSGSIATFFAWACAFQKNESDAALKSIVSNNLTPNPAMQAAYSGCILTRGAAMSAYDKLKRSTTTTDILHHLSSTVEALVPTSGSDQGNSIM